jgi:hypothetical protein
MSGVRVGLANENETIALQELVASVQSAIEARGGA